MLKKPKESKWIKRLERLILLFIPLNLLFYFIITATWLLFDIKLIG